MDVPDSETLENDVEPLDEESPLEEVQEFGEEDEHSVPSEPEPLAESDIELVEQVAEKSLDEQPVGEVLSEVADEEEPVLLEEAISEETVEEDSVSEQLEERQEEFQSDISDVEVPVTDEFHEDDAEQLDVEEELITSVEESSEIPATIELPEETPTLETQEVPAPDPGQTDPLAQPVSRKEWDAFVEHLIDPASPDHEPVSVLFLDVDHFKAINEGFGRQIGTDLLTEISRRLSQACGKRELSCQYGGGQFAIACPGINLEKARKRGDQFRKLIDRTRFDVLPFHSLTVSVGVASLEEGDDLTEVMNRAEHGLYQAKQSGQNCSVGLSSAEIAVEMKAVEDNMSKLITGEFDVETHFEAMVASDMIVYKLGGFLYDMHAKLLHVDRRHVSMRVGKKGLLPYWARQDDDRPVLIDLELGEGWNQQRSDKGLLTNTRINVKIRPDGWVRSQETFLKRAHFVLRELKGYFVTN
jgi:diguanylate cyclase (GGDEF)-like protein